MRVLFVSNNFPIDLRIKTHGIYKRMGLFIDAIKSFASIDFLYYVSPDTDVSAQTVSRLNQDFSKYWQADTTLFLCQRSAKQHRILRRSNYLPGAINFFDQTSYVGVSTRSQVQALETCLLHKPDAIFAHRLQAMCPLMLTNVELPPIFFDLDDIEHISLSRQLKQPASYRKKSLNNYLYLPSLKRGELRAIRKAHKTFVCSDDDRAYLTKQLDLPGVVTIANAIKLPQPQPLTSEPNLLFIGSYTYQPNVSAAEFLIEKIWPHIRQAVPNARLVIAGASPDRIRRYKTSDERVEFPGFVEDLDKLYKKTRVVCSPILSGGGTRLKLIEAAAYQKPIVSTQIGAEGLALLDGEAVFIRDDPRLFANACIELLQSNALCKRLGDAAAKTATKYHDRAQIIKQLQHHFQS